MIATTSDRRALRLAVALFVLTGCATVEAQWERRHQIWAGITQPHRTDPDPRAPIDELPDAGRTVAGEPSILAGGEQPVHVVRAGETLGEIAGRYRVQVSAICELNRIRDPDWIKVGQRLRLPQPAQLSSRSTPAPPREHPHALARAQALLIEAEEHYLDARFERALERSQQAEALLEREPGAGKLRARAAFVAGSALAGLGDDQRATEQFARVHAFDSRFEPPAGWLSPRLGALYVSASAR